MASKINLVRNPSNRQTASLVFKLVHSEGKTWCVFSIPNLKPNYQP